MVGRTGVFAAVVAALCLAAFAAAAHADPPPPDMFDGAGMFLDNPQDVPDAQTLGTWLQQAHFSWVALHVDDGPTLEALTPEWFAELRAHGLKVGIWGAERNNVEADVAVANLAVDTFGADFYIADAENPFMNKGKYRSAQFVAAFRQLQPTLPAALVTLGAAKAPFVLPMNYAAWRAGGFDLLPEAYYNQYKGDRPDLTVAHAERAGWALGAVHPVIGIYHGYPAANYVPLLQNLGTQGFSVFLADQMTQSDYAALSGLAELAATG